MVKDCTDDQKKVGVFSFLHKSKAVQGLLNSVITMVFKNNPGKLQNGYEMTGMHLDIGVGYIKR